MILWPMPIDVVVQLLLAERQKIDAALVLLQGGQKRRGRPPKNPLANAPDWVLPPKKKRKISAAARKKMAAAQKARWAKVKKESA